MVSRMELEKRLLSNDAEENREGLEFLKSIHDLKNEEQIEIIKAVFYLIWKTPKYREQVRLIDNIHSIVGNELFRCLFFHTVNEFSNVETDRKDKFYYLAKKALPLLTLEEIISLENLELKEYLLRFVDENTKGWDETKFLDFISGSPGWMCQSISVRIDEAKVRPFLEKKNIDSKTREALYNIIKK